MGAMEYKFRIYFNRIFVCKERQGGVVTLFSALFSDGLYCIYHKLFLLALRTAILVTNEICELASLD